MAARTMFNTMSDADVVRVLDERVAVHLLRASVFVRWTDAEIVVWLDKRLARNVAARASARTARHDWYARNKAHVSAYDAEWRATHRDHIRARRLANRERINQYKRDARARSARARAAVAAERAAERAAIAAERAALVRCMREAARQESARISAERERERQRRKKARRVADLQPIYLRDKISQRGRIDRSLITEEHLAIQRTKILFTRALRANHV